MNNADTITKRQFVALVFVSLLPPLIRRFPRLLAALAGRSAWIAAVLAALPLSIAVMGFRLLYRRAAPGSGFPEILTALLGSAAAKRVTGLYSLWMLFYAGFLLRSGGLRFVSTVYPGASTGVFVLSGALVCACAASGSLRALGRCAMILRPLLAAIPVLVFLLTVKDADFRLLLPVPGGADPGALALSALRVTNIFGVAVYFSFFGSAIGDGPFRRRDYLPWTAAVLGITFLITAGALGLFGPELTARMNHPFFMLARDVSVLGALERVEPAAIAVWVFADFLLVSTLLWTAAQNLRFCLYGPPCEAASSPAGAAAARAEAAGNTAPPAGGTDAGHSEVHSRAGLGGDAAGNGDTAESAAGRRPRSGAAGHTGKVFAPRRSVPWLSALCAALAALAGTLLPEDAAAFAWLSDTLVPVLSAVFVFGLPALLLPLSLLRGPRPGPGQKH